MSKGLPEVLGRYQILRAIGEGGIGKLYLARDPDIEREVAIKVLREGLDDAELRERFAREARSAGRLQHINIVTIYDVGKHEGQPYIAMEYVKGETLGALLKSHQPTSLSRKFQIMEDLCSGLHYAHRAGVVHRDIKPGNIIISDDGILKILDFGIARLGGSGMTQAGMVMGTLNYMPPEQMEGRPVDARADMFSAGAVFYELLCFKLAFPGDLRTGIVVKILNGKPEPLEHLCPHLDPAVVALVNRCLEKQPDKRYADMDAVRRELVKLRRRVVEEEEQSQEAPTMISGQLPTGEWPATIKPTMAPPPSTSSAPSSAVESSRAKSLRIRAEQLHTHVSRARHAIETEDYHAVMEACQHALVLDPENAEANDLEARARAALDEQQLQQWISEGREELNRGALTVAAGLVDKALAQNRSSPDAISLRTAVADALKRRAAEQARAREFADAMARAERDLAAGSLDAATAAIDRALELQKGDLAGRALQGRIASAVEAKRRADEIAHAKQAVTDARERFAAGDHSGALETLESVESGATIVGAVLEELRREAKEIERKRVEAEAAAAREQEEQERRRRAEEERRQKEEAEARRLAAEAAVREQQEQERQRKAAEEARLAAEAARREQEKEARRQKQKEEAEAEARRLAAEAAVREQQEQARQRKAAEEARLAAEAARREQEKEARRQKEEAEARRLAAEAALRREKEAADARRLAAEAAERREKEEQEARRLAAEAARKAEEKKEQEGRRRQEIALKTSEASASFRHQKFDEALALVRAALAIDPQHREAKALEASIAQAAERRRDASAALADARASVERAQFDAALKTLARARKIDPGLQGIDEVRQAAEAGRAKAEAAERTRREVDRLLARAAKAVARREWPRALDEVGQALRLDGAHEGAIKLKQQIDESVARERPAPAKRDIGDEPTIRASGPASLALADEPTIQASASASPALADEPTIQASMSVSPAVADEPTIEAPARARVDAAVEATIQAPVPAAWRESVVSARLAVRTLDATSGRSIPFPEAVPSARPASEAGEAISDRAPAVERPATNRRLLIAAAAVIVAAVLAGTLVIPMLRREPATAPTETSAPGTAGTPGTIVLNIAPWATIDAITRKSDGQRVGEPNLVTPVVVALPAGEYHVKASNPAFSQALEFDLSVAAGGVQEVRRAMPDLQPEEEVTRILTSQ